MPETVLLTGITGFVGLHCAAECLRNGYAIKGTLRDLSRRDEVFEILEKEVPGSASAITLCEADLLKDDNWNDIAEGCALALHIASPFETHPPKNERDLIEPAVEGTLRVLNAAAKAGIRRVVLTSSMVAVWYGHPPRRYAPFTEQDWTNPDGRTVSAYTKSKTLAEINAWDFIKSPKANGMELSVINPGVIFGPNLGSQTSASAEMIIQLMNGTMPGVPRLGYAAVDVRDVAHAHVKALFVPEAVDSRFICAIDHVWWREIAQVLQAHFARRGYKVPTNVLPDLIPKALAIVRKDVRAVLRDLGAERHIDNAHIRNVLDWEPRILDEMVVAMAESLIAQGHIKTPKKKKAA